MLRFSLETVRPRCCTDTKAVQCSTFVRRTYYECCQERRNSISVDCRPVAPLETNSRNLAAVRNVLSPVMPCVARVGKFHLQIFSRSKPSVHCLQEKTPVVIFSLLSPPVASQQSRIIITGAAVAKPRPNQIRRLRL